MSSAHVNHYRRRKVAQANEKPCSVCYRPTDTVLMSKDSQDWFYCCSQHLKDPGLAIPIVDQAAEQERLKKIEIAKVKAEYEEKQRRKAELEKQEKDAKDKKASSWLSNPFAAKKEEKPKTPEPNAVSAGPEPTEFTLHRTLYQHRVNLKAQAAQKKARDAHWATLQFPSAPS